MKNKLSLVLGASPKEDRYSNRAVKALKSHGFEVVAVGRGVGEIDGVEIQQGQPHIENVDTVTLYIGPQHQPEFYEYMLNLKPRRIIMNPGTENDELERKAKDQGIIVENACTLVLLSIGNYF
ncbi:MAG: CoA-binding protein [Bacteroidetes bacterium]|nr:CoA-binding protein [Bacteroidota bacterium]